MFCSFSLERSSHAADLTSLFHRFTFHFSLEPAIRHHLFWEDLSASEIVLYILSCVPTDPCTHPNYHTSKLRNCLFMSSPIIFCGHSTVPHTCPAPWSLILNKYPLNIGRMQKVKKKQTKFLSIYLPIRFLIFCNTHTNSYSHTITHTHPIPLALVHIGWHMLFFPLTPASPCNFF